MPELPEIETIRRVIAPQIQGLAVQRVTVIRPEVIAHPDAIRLCVVQKKEKMTFTTIGHLLPGVSHSPARL